MLKPGSLKKFKPVGGSSMKFKPPVGGGGALFMSTPSSFLKSSSAARPLSVASATKVSSPDGEENPTPASAAKTPKQPGGSSSQQGPFKPKPLAALVPKTPSQPVSQRCAEDETPELTEEEKERKKANARAMMQGSLKVERKPFIGNGILNAGPMKKFNPPGDQSTYTKSLTKKLGGAGYKCGMLQSKFGGGGIFSKPSSAPRVKLSASVNSVVSSDGESSSDDDSDDENKPEFLPHEPLVVWTPTPDEVAAGCVPTPVPKVLAQFLRPHQRAGVEFCCECLLGLKEFEGHGCILADDMGLGKTLQAIATMYTLMRSGRKGGSVGVGEPGDNLLTVPTDPIVKRTIVVCPCSLVNNWAQEFEKWVNCRVKTEGEKVKALAMSATDKKSVLFAITQFLHVTRPYDVLIISYETFRMYVGKFTKKNDCCCDLLVCDEAHRLKNPDALTTKALASLACRRRVLLSGTPVQNDLDEFFAMADFTNPGVLGSSEDFRRKYKNPILAGREPGCSQTETDRAKVLQNEMSSIVNQFIIRRTNTINAKFLPDKLVQIVCCKLTTVQRDIYRHLVGTKDVQSALSGKTKDALSYIQNMQKLCNHPKILELSCGGKTKGVTREELSVFGVPLDQPGDDEAKRCKISPELSGKMQVLHNLMDVMWKDQTPKAPPDKIVVISIYTQTLDLVERLCKGKKWPVVRLDGSMAPKKRMELVNVFNDPLNRNAFCFLLSSKAGGCGLNLIGANRLVLFDSDWNPATDKQAAARCWRDGQKKHCYTYRFLSAGTLEEKIFQRQLSKEGLAAVVEDKEQVNALSSGDLKDLFKFRENTPSDTHDKLKCTYCRLALDESLSQGGAPTTLGAAQVQFLDELLDWMKCLPAAQGFLGGRSSGGGGGADVAVVAVDVAVGDDEPGAVAVGAASGTAVKAKASSKVKVGDLATMHAKLHGGGFVKLSDFHKDMRQLFASSRKAFEVGSAALASAEACRELFEAHWQSLGPTIEKLQAGAGGHGARVFTEEELQKANADIEAASLASRAGSGRPGGQRFNFSVGLAKPVGVAKPKLLGGGVLKPGDNKSLPAASSASSSSSSSSTAAEGGGSRRTSLSQGPAHKPQHEMPKEEDLNNWSHHFSVESCDDKYLRQAVSGTDLVTFVFGLHVNWDLTQKQTALDEGRDAADKSRRDQELESAKGRLGDKKGKGKKKAAAADSAENAEHAGASGADNTVAAAEVEKGTTRQAECVGGGGDEGSSAGEDESADDENDDVQGVAAPPKDKQKAKDEQNAKRGLSFASETASAAVDDESEGALIAGVCIFCTFANSPSAKKCSMCNEKIPQAPKAKKTPVAVKVPIVGKKRPAASADPAAAGDRSGKAKGEPKKKAKAASPPREEPPVFAASAKIAAPSPMLMEDDKDDVGGSLVSPAKSDEQSDFE